MLHTPLHLPRETFLYRIAVGCTARIESDGSVTQKTEIMDFLKLNVDVSVLSRDKQIF